MIASSFWLPPDISEHGSQIDIIIKYLHWFMAILFVAWGSYFLYCLVRFRAGANPKATYGDAKAKPSKVAEIVVIVIEAALLVGFSIPVWVRRLVTMAPAFVIVGMGFDSTQALVMSQVILSIALPVPMVALLMFTGRRDIMGDHVNGPATRIAAALGAAIVLALNVVLILSAIGAPIPGLT